LLDNPISSFVERYSYYAASSVIIQDIEHISDTGSAYMAYFFFDFKDYRKQDARALLSSVLVQLSRQSVSFNNVLLEFYLLHQRGSKQPSDSALLQCLEKMLRIPGKVPIYLIIDALDECSDNSGVQSPREKVLRLFEKLVRFHLPNLRLCVTSRTEVGIRNVLEPLTSRRNRISLHDEDGQKKGIADYVSSVFCSDVMTMRWREEDKKLVISALSDRNGGVYVSSFRSRRFFLLQSRFLWVSCQIGALRRCLAPSVRPVVQELPENLEETYERIIQGIPKANRVHAHRLLQCLTVAARPLHVQELAEVLAVDLSAAGGIPKLNEDWRWDDQEQAVLTACSGLITVIDDQASRMVQFSHSSVRDFLTSDRLATAEVDTLRYYHIRPEPAHTIISQACISVLLRLEYPVDSKCLKRFPLADYAAKHFAHHAEFGDVISQITDGIDNLLDEEKPHFGAWMSLLSSSLVENHPRLETSPLYHLAGLGYHGLVHHLLSRRPQDTIVRSGILGLSAHAALNQRHIQVCQLLLPHCISVDVRNSDGQTPLHVAARHGHLEAARMIIGQGADMNARDNNGWTPLQEATFRGYFDVTQLLLEHGASVHARNKDGWTPLHEASRYGYLDIIQPLLEHGADRNAMNDNYCTPLHLAAAHGQLAATKFLVEQGAITHVPNKDGWTPLHEAAFHGYPDVMRPLLEHGASVHVRNKDGWTPLHEASCYGYLSIIQLLLEHGADRNAMNDDHCTPLHLAAARGQLAATRLLVEQGVNIDVPNKNGRTPLYQAAFHGHLETVRFLLEHGASVHVQNKDGWTPLHEASFYGYLDVVRLLLDHDADRDAVDHIYRTPLHLTASRGQLATSRLLVEQGAVINARNINDWTPLHEATFHGHLSIVRFLLEHGASVHVQNKDGWSLLHEASCYGYLNILRLLLEHGADLNAANHNYCTPLHLAAAKGQLAATRLLVEQGATTGVPNKDGWTPLNEATFHRRADIVQFLLEHDASVHIANKDGWTPLHDASCYGYTDIIRLLLKHGANLEATNNERNTPLHLAANKGQLSATQLLVENGAVVGAQNKNGWTPLHEASVHGHSDVILFLLDHTTNGRAGQQARNTAV
jgi:ankyrin repeat protein